ncbi:hypothetical protein Tco_0191326 [Tanacetum coccineum]
MVVLGDTYPSQRCCLGFALRLPLHKHWLTTAYISCFLGSSTGGVYRSPGSYSPWPRDNQVSLQLAKVLSSFPSSQLNSMPTCMVFGFRCHTLGKLGRQSHRHNLSILSASSGELPVTQAMLAPWNRWFCHLFFKSDHVIAYESSLGHCPRCALRTVVLPSWHQSEGVESVVTGGGVAVPGP